MEDKDTVQKSDNGINDRIKDLIRFARGKGYLTLHDISDHLPESINNPEDIENVMNILDNLEVTNWDNSTHKFSLIKIIDTSKVIHIDTI